VAPTAGGIRNVILAASPRKSLAKHATWYGVVIAPGGGIDEAATSALRPKLTQARSVMRIADDALDAYVGLNGRQRIVELAATDAAHSGVADDGPADSAVGKGCE